MISRQSNKNNAVILLYHGVTESKSLGIENYSGKHIQAEDFKNQLKFLKKNNNVITIYQLINCIVRKVPFPEYSVVITFDDGFENNYSVAFPLLRKFNIPATFFLLTGFIGTKKMFWVDKIEHAINLTKRKKISINLDNITYKCSIASIEEKIAFLNRIKRYLKSIEGAKKGRVIFELMTYLECRAEEINNVTNYRKLTWEQVIEMSKSPLVSLGVHSKTHPKLSKVPINKLCDEIVLPKKMLEEKINRNVDIFSYPEGQKGDYNDDVISFLKKSGFICSVSAISGYNTLRANPFHLKREFVGFMGRTFPLSF